MAHPFSSPGRGHRLALLTLAALITTGCSMDRFRSERADRMPVAGAPEQLRYASDLQVDLAAMTRTGSGLYYRDLVPGSGEAVRAGDRVRVAYRGWLANGQLFDQSGPGQPYALVLGAHQVIPGWEEGLTGMRAGGRRQLVIPPALAYGDVSPGAGIPANATLIFEVELVSIEPPSTVEEPS